MEQALFDGILGEIKKYQQTYGLALKDVVNVLDLLHHYFANEMVKECMIQKPDSTEDTNEN